MLSKQRQAKLDKALQELDEAEQYVILVDVEGYYPCFNCGDEPLIYLYNGEIWKYGTTIKGEKSRYGNAISR